MVILADMDDSLSDTADTEALRTDDLHEAARALIPGATEVATIEGHPEIARKMQGALVDFMRRQGADEGYIQAFTSI